MPSAVICSRMRTFIFRCPHTGANVQGWVAKDVSLDENAFVSIECLACRQSHLVNSRTGKTLGDDKTAR